MECEVSLTESADRIRSSMDRGEVLKRAFWKQGADLQAPPAAVLR